MNLSLNDAERAHLATLGVTVAADGTMRSASGREVSAGTAVQLLSKAADGGLAKMTPLAFERHYLAAGHAAESPANTGARATTALPDSHPAESQDYRRGWITRGHEQAPPDDRPANNPHEAGTPGSEVYTSAAGVYAANQAQVRSEHVLPSQNVTAQPANVRQAAVPSDMRASSVPVALTVAASRPAPGEMR